LRQTCSSSDKKNFNNIRKLVVISFWIILLFKISSIALFFKSYRWKTSLSSKIFCAVSIIFPFVYDEMMVFRKQLLLLQRLCNCNWINKQASRQSSRQIKRQIYLRKSSCLTFRIYTHTSSPMRITNEIFWIHEIPRVHSEKRAESTSRATFLCPCRCLDWLCQPPQASNSMRCQY